jgi:hypothetical protein
MELVEIYQRTLVREKVEGRDQIQREQDIVLAVLEEFLRRQDHVFIIRNVDLNQGH